MQNFDLFPYLAPYLVFGVFAGIVALDRRRQLIQWLRRKRCRDWVQTKAVVQSRRVLTVTGRGNKKSYQLQIGYSYTFDGGDYSGFYMAEPFPERLRAGFMDAHPMGSTIRIRVNPKKPSNQSGRSIETRTGVQPRRMVAHELPSSTYDDRAW
jgi:Protein of unknown function (DUF3592)